MKIAFSQKKPCFLPKFLHCRRKTKLKAYFKLLDPFVSNVQSFFPINRAFGEPIGKKKFAGAA